MDRFELELIAPHLAVDDAGGTWLWFSGRYPHACECGAQVPGVWYKGSSVRRLCMRCVILRPMLAERSGVPPGGPAKTE
jgi:hypothetical protein